MLEFDKYRKANKLFVIKIYKKKIKKPFCEVEVPDDTYLKNVYEELNKEGKYVQFWNVIIPKEDFDYATIEEEI